MAKRRNRKIIYIFATIILLAALLFVFGYLQTFFKVREDALVQLVTTDANEDCANDCPSVNYKNEFGIRSGTLSGTCTNNCQGDVNPIIHAVFQSPNTVTINTGKNVFRFVAEKTGNIGNFGLNDNPVFYCWQRINVYKNDVLEDTLTSWSGNGNELNEDYFRSNTYKVYDDKNDQSSTSIEITMDDLGEGSKARFGRGCGLFANNYKLQFSENAFDVNISIPERAIVEGDNLTVNINIKNNLDLEVTSRLGITFKTTTILGDVEKTENIDLDLSPGDNKLTYEFPGTMQETEMRVKVIAEILYPGDALQGLNEYRKLYNTLECSNTNGNGGCEEYRIYRGSSLLTAIDEGFINLGSVETKEEIFSISPRPLYLPLEGDDCPSGYTPNVEETYCIRDDIASLTCFVIGCPNIEGVQYQCTSGGFCAETVFIPQQCKYDQETYLLLNETERNEVDSNEVCPIGTSCDVPTGFCINSELYDEFLKCTSSSECPIPCNGVTPICNEINRCAYPGYPEQCIAGDYGCKQTGCDSGFTCEEKTNSCVSNTIKLSYIVIFAIIIVVVLIIFLILRKKKRR